MAPSGGAAPRHYSSEMSVTLMIAQELKKEIKKRHKLTNYRSGHRKRGRTNRY
jgi:hypothetical protein